MCLSSSNELTWNIQQICHEKDRSININALTACCIHIRNKNGINIELKYPSKTTGTERTTLVSMLCQIVLALNKIDESLWNLPFLNPFPSGQNGRHFTDDVFEYIVMNEKFDILNQLSLIFVPKGQINNIPALVQKMAWYRSGDKPLSEPMLTQLTDLRHQGKMRQVQFIDALHQN